jgi:hypothetical protein
MLANVQRDAATMPALAQVAEQAASLMASLAK